MVMGDWKPNDEIPSIRWLVPKKALERKIVFPEPPSRGSALVRLEGWRSSRLPTAWRDHQILNPYLPIWVAKIFFTRLSEGRDWSKTIGMHTMVYPVRWLCQDANEHKHVFLVPNRVSRFRLSLPAHLLHLSGTAPRGKTIIRQLKGSGASGGRLAAWQSPLGRQVRLKMERRSTRTRQGLAHWRITQKLPALCVYKGRIHSAHFR